MKTIIKAVYLVALMFNTTVFAGVLLQDDFSSGNYNQWTTFDGVFSVTNGAFRIASTSFANDARAVSGNTNWIDYSIDLDANLINPNGSLWPCSILFRVEEISSGVDSGKYYELNIGPSLIIFGLINYSGGNAQGLTQTNIVTTTNTWHHVTLVVSGTNGTAFIDGKQVLTYNGFSSYPYGKVGLKSINGAANLFDNVVVATLAGPAIGQNPASQTVSTGQAVTFSVSATGTAPLRYQWLFNGTNIVGATNAIYTISATSTMNIGFYSVAVANTISTNYSSSASLGLVDLKMLASVYLNGPIGSSYRIDSTPQLAPNNWSTLTNVTISSQPYIYVDYSTPTNSMQFYRAVPQ